MSGYIYRGSKFLGPEMDAETRAAWRAYETGNAACRAEYDRLMAMGEDVWARHPLMVASDPALEKFRETRRNYMRRKRAANTAADRAAHAAYMRAYRARRAGRQEAA